MDIDTTMSPKEWINAQLREGDKPLELRLSVHIVATTYRTCYEILSLRPTSFSERSLARVT